MTIESLSRLPVTESLSTLPGTLETALSEVLGAQPYGACDVVPRPRAEVEVRDPDAARGQGAAETHPNCSARRAATSSPVP